MSANSRMTIATHVLTWMSLDRKNNEVATSERIAGSVNTNPVVIRRCLGDLRKAGLVGSRGAGAGWILKREPEEITLLEVYLAVEGEGPFAMHHTPPNADCPVGFESSQPCSRCTAAWSSRCSNSWLAPRSLTCCKVSSLSGNRAPTPSEPRTQTAPGPHGRQPSRVNRKHWGAAGASRGRVLHHAEHAESRLLASRSCMVQPLQADHGRRDRMPEARTTAIRERRRTPSTAHRSTPFGTLRDRRKLRPSARPSQSRPRAVT